MVLVFASVVAAAAIIVPQVMGSREAADDLAAKPSAAPAGSSAGESASTSEARLESEFMLRCFMDARIRRDFDLAKKCMTQRLIDSYSDPVEFLGASSPNIQRFTIKRDAENTSERKVVELRAYIGSSNALMFYSDDVIELVKDDGNWKVNRWDRGAEQPIGETTEITVYFPPTETLCKDVRASDLLAVTREVKASDNPAFDAVQELLSGLTPADSAHGTFFPLGTRVESVRLDASGGEVRLNSVANYGIPCVRAANRAALERTIGGFVDPAMVEISPEL